MSNYKKYRFTIGDSPARVYEGLRMPPKPDGFEFGYKFRAAIRDVLQSLSAEELQRMRDGDFGGLIKGLTGKFSPSIMLEYWNFVLNNQAATIQANIDGKTKVYVFSDDKMFNEWFSMHPEDLTEVMYTCVWENAAPFLPALWKEAMIEIREQLEKKPENPAAENQAESG